MSDQTPKISQFFSAVLPDKVVSFSVSGISIYFSKRFADDIVSSSTGLNPNVFTIPASLAATMIAASNSENKKTVIAGGVIGILFTLLGSEEEVQLEISESNTFVLHDDKIFYQGVEISFEQYKTAALLMGSNKTPPEIMVLEGTSSTGFFDKIVLFLHENNIIYRENIIDGKIDFPFFKDDFPTISKLDGFRQMLQKGILTFEMGAEK